MTFLRLSRWDWVAFVAALGLLLVMSADWWTTRQGEECRRIEQLQPPAGSVQGGAISSDIKRSARECAEKQEKNAWQAPGAIDRFILVVLLVGVASAIGAGFFRAAGRRYEPPLTPSAVAAAAGLLAALLILYRILQPPGLNSAAVVKWGAPVGLALAGIMAIAARAASVVEREAPAEAAEEARPDTEPEPEAEPEGAGEGEPVVETEELPAEAEPPVEPEPTSEPIPEAEPPAEPEPEPGPIPEAEPATEPEPEPGDEADSSPGGFATGSAPA